MKKLVFALLLIFTFALAINISSAALQCAIKANCGGGETTVGKVTDISDGHFGEPDDNSVTYNARFCCWGIDIRANPPDPIIFKLSSSGDAHLGGLYNVPPGGAIRLSSTKAGVTITCDSSTTTDDCAFSLSSLYETSGQGNGGAHADVQCDKPGYFNLYCGAKCDPDMDADCCNNDAGATPSINSVQALREPTPWDSCDTTGNCFSLGGNVSQTACCGDDNGENKKVSAGAGSDGTAACCAASTQCVNNSLCTASTVCGGANGGYYCNSGTWEITDSDADGYDDRCDSFVGDPCSVFKQGDNCNNLLGQGCGGCLNGTVTNSTGTKLPSAIVQAVGFPKYKATTDSKGDYLIFNITPRNYDFSAEKLGYESVLRSNMPISGVAMTTINFVLGHGSSLCQADCSYTSDGLCHAECEGACDGVSCCTFYDSGTKSICNNRLVNFRMNYNDTHEIQCCKGSPYMPLKAVATTQINATNVVRSTRSVWYEGKLVKLVIDVFG